MYESVPVGLDPGEGGAELSLLQRGQDPVELYEGLADVLALVLRYSALPAHCSVSHRTAPHHTCSESR